MKKISLKDLHLGLKRDEMRQISGGCVGACSTNKCTVYTGTATYTGFCAGISTGNVASCYCNTAYGYYTPTSNGGNSRCWN